MSDRPVTSPPHDPAHPRDAVGAEIVFDDVHLSLGGRSILSGLDAVVPPGRITVILGMSGAGKSVMMRLALGLLRPDRGRVLVDGHDLARASAVELAEIRKGFGVAFQANALFTSLDVSENVAFPMREHTRLSSREIATRVAELLASVDLPDAGHKRPDELSGGMQKRVAFARALALTPRVVFLDEPSSGLDPVIASRIDEVILRLHTRHPATYFVITHDLPSAQTIADQVGVLHEGKLALFLPAEEFWNSRDPIVRQLLERQPHGPIAPSGDVSPAVPPEEEPAP